MCIRDSFTTGQCLQMHGLDGDTILNLFKECHEHGIYNRGAGGDNPNVVASILRGIDPRETLDLSLIHIFKLYLYKINYNTF